MDSENKDERLHPEIYLDRFFERFNEYPNCHICKQEMTSEQANANDIIYIGGMTDSFYHKHCYYTPREDREPIPLIQPTILFDEETCNKIDWKKFYPYYPF
jgi:hypothetical protein